MALFYNCVKAVCQVSRYNDFIILVYFYQQFHKVTSYTYTCTSYMIMCLQLIDICGRVPNSWDHVRCNKILPAYCALIKA